MYNIYLKWKTLKTLLNSKFLNEKKKIYKNKKIETKQIVFCKKYDFGDKE